jgi:hypothetical protein
MVQRSGGQASERRHRQRLAIVGRAGTAQEAVDGDRHSGALRPGDDRQVDLAPHPSGRRAQERNAGSTLRTTKGSATSVWARTTSSGEVRRSSGGSSSAASGSAKSASISPTLAPTTAHSRPRRSRRWVTRHGASP